MTDIREELLSILSQQSALINLLTTQLAELKFALNRISPPVEDIDSISMDRCAHDGESVSIIEPSKPMKVKTPVGEVRAEAGDLIMLKADGAWVVKSEFRHLIKGGVE